MIILPKFIVKFDWNIRRQNEFLEKLFKLKFLATHWNDSLRKKSTSPNKGASTPVTQIIIQCSTISISLPLTPYYFLILRSHWFTSWKQSLTNRIRCLCGSETLYFHVPCRKQSNNSMIVNIMYVISCVTENMWFMMDALEVRKTCFHAKTENSEVKGKKKVNWRIDCRFYKFFKSISTTLYFLCRPVASQVAQQTTSISHFLHLRAAWKL